MAHWERLPVFWSVLVLCALVSAGAAPPKDKGIAAPKAYHAKTYPAHDAHDNEKVAIAVDPYDMPDKTYFFTVNYKREGFLPMRLMISNDGDTPVALTDLKVELITVNKTKIEPATPDDIYRRIARQGRRGDEASRNPLPIPLPRRSAKRSVSREAEAEIESSRFLAKAVEPHATQAGFLFFDVQGIENPLHGARLYVSGIRTSEGQELMYFEVPLEKYLTYQPPVH